MDKSSDPLYDAPEHQVRSVLIALCEGDRSIREKATKYLAQLKTLELSKPTATATTDSSDTHGVKRKADSAIRICIQCQNPFYDNENNDIACTFHDGDLDVNDEGDFWADHDEDCHGEIDTEEMREEFPEGFVWSCCEKDGTDPGCTKGRHEATDTDRGRYPAQRGTGTPKE